MARRPLRLLLLAIAIEVFSVVFALGTTFGGRGVPMVVAIIGLVVAFVGYFAKD